MLPLAGATGLLIVGVGIFLLGYLADPRVSERDVAVVRDSEGVSTSFLAGKPVRDSNASSRRLVGPNSPRAG